MGHISEIKKEYKDLRKRLDMNPVGAPEAEGIYDVLKIMFSEEQARVGAQMPMAPATLGKISRKTGIPEAKLRDILETMADRGVVMDFHNKKNDKTYYMLAPTVVGFFEFSLMRTRDDIPQKELSEAMYKYMYGTHDFAKDVFQKNTQLGRALVAETALSEDDLSEVLEWERATHLVGDAELHGVSMCYCHHKAQHLGKECERPTVTCLSIGMGADWLIRRNLAKQISKEESMDIMVQSREMGLVQTADNVQKEVSFICNCCGCCCGMLSAMNYHGLSNAVHTSNYIAEIDKEACKGCAKCAKKCPIKAIEMKEEQKEDGKKNKWAEVDKSICLGCGVCHGQCKFESIAMKKRKKRDILTPEGTMERVLRMAIERGKLQNFLFDDVPNADFLKNLTGAALKLPVTKKILLNNEVQSRFIEFITSKSGM